MHTHLSITHVVSPKDGKLNTILPYQTLIPFSVIHKYYLAILFGVHIKGSYVPPRMRRLSE